MIFKNLCLFKGCREDTAGPASQDAGFSADPVLRWMMDNIYIRTTPADETGREDFMNQFSGI